MASNDVVSLKEAQEYLIAFEDTLQQSYPSFCNETPLRSYITRTTNERTSFVNAVTLHHEEKLVNLNALNTKLVDEVQTLREQLREKNENKKRKFTQNNSVNITSDKVRSYCEKCKRNRFHTTEQCWRGMVCGYCQQPNHPENRCYKKHRAQGSTFRNTHPDRRAQINEKKELSTPFDYKKMAETFFKTFAMAQSKSSKSNEDPKNE